MQIEFAFFADSVQMTPNGKVNIFGANLVCVEGDFPLTLPTIGLVVKVLLDPSDCGAPHRLSGEFIAPDGERIAPSDDSYMEMPCDSDSIAVASLILFEIQGTTFNAPGVYRYRFSIDGREVKSLALSASHPTIGAPTEAEGAIP